MVHRKRGSAMTPIPSSEPVDSTPPWGPAQMWDLLDSSGLLNLMISLSLSWLLYVDDLKSYVKSYEMSGHLRPLRIREIAGYWRRFQEELIHVYLDS